MILLLLALAAILPDGSTLRKRCDVIELNHFYDDQQLRAWRMLKGGYAAKDSVFAGYMHPRRENGVWVSEFMDGDLHRRVEADVFRESWTQYDPELTEREFLPKEKRKELRKAVKRGE